MTTREPKRIATQRVIDAAMQWHHQLSLAGPNGDFESYKAASERLQRACARLKKVSKGTGKR